MKELQRKNLLKSRPSHLRVKGEKQPVLEITVGETAASREHVCLHIQESKRKKSRKFKAANGHVR
jgi:hypothetical protein